MVSLIFGIIALACSILSWFPSLVPSLSAMSLILGIIGFILAIVAIATGNGILKSDRANGSARAGKAIGVVCIVISILAIVFMFIVPVVIGVALFS